MATSVQPRFGTNGVRGVVGKEITADFALRFGGAVGAFFGGGRIAVATDTRTSKDMLSQALLAGLTSSGCDVVHLGEIPTPALQYYVPARRLQGGVTVTASHNPAEFNGFKVVGADGMDASRDEERRIESSFDEVRTPVSWDRCGRVTQAADGVAVYLEDILLRVDGAAIRAGAPRIVVDCANGAAVHTTPDLLRRLGCTVLTLNGHPDGTFPGRPPEPKEENLRELARLVVQTGADLGIAHDGDADRAVFIDDRGRYVHGDRALAVMARAVLAKRKGLIVTPVTSSSCVEDVVLEAGGTLEYTAVGAPTVSRRMKETGALLGGEESGGLMFPELHFAKDGGMAAARMVELVATGTRLSEAVDALPPYVLVRRSVPVAPEAHDAVVGALLDVARREKVLTVDGFKFIRNEGWVLVRPSGTEPLFRLYAEAKKAEDAETLAKFAEDLIRGALPRA